MKYFLLRINESFIEKIIYSISTKNIKILISKKKISFFKKKLILKILKLSNIHYYSIIFLTTALNIVNLGRSNIFFLEKIYFFLILKKFYKKLILFIYYSYNN